MIKKIIIVLLMFAVLIPTGGTAEAIEIEGVDFEKIDFERLSDFSFNPGEIFSFLEKARDLGNRIYELVSKIWEVAGSLLESVTGLTLGELFTGLINATIGIIEVMIELLSGVL